MNSAPRRRSVRSGRAYARRFSLVSRVTFPLWSAPAVSHRRGISLFAALVMCLATRTLAQVSPEAPPPDAPKAEQGEVIQEVRVENNRRIEAAAIVRALTQKVGNPFDKSKTQNDLRGLWSLKYFSDIKLLTQQTPKGLIYVVRVTEKPAVRSIEYEGLSALSKDDFKEAVTLKPFSILNLSDVKANAKKISDKYVEKGYFLAEVKYRIRPREGEQEVDVVFEINEHAKVQVRDINFIGAIKISPQQLRSSMQTQVGGYLSFLTSQGTYREEVFQRDLQLVQLVYYDNGFVNVHLDKPIVSLSPDKRYISISIRIEEGDQYKIGKIDVAGELVAPREEMLKDVGSTTGNIFVRSQLARDIQAITDRYYDQGYAYANITPATVVNAEEKTIDITLEVQKGEPQIVDRIEVVGNTKTRDKVIRRQLRVYEGELFNGTGMRRSKDKVSALGFFESVELTHKPGRDNKHVVVTVEVKEKSTGTFQVGLGFSNVESFIFTAQIAQQNFLGWGQTVSASAQLSSLRQFYQLNYFDPYFLDTNFLLSVDLYRTQLTYTGFVRTATGGTVSLGYYLIADEMSLSLGYTYEGVYVEPYSTASAIALYGQYRSGSTSTLRLSWTWDHRDNRLFPSSGFLAFASIETSPAFLGGTFNYNRYTAYFRKYFKLPFNSVLKFNIQAGQIQDLSSKNALPASELYYLGGITSIRGYSLRTVSPTTLVGSSIAPDVGVFPFAVGGDKNFVFNLELEFTILAKVGIKGVLFYDAGNVFPRGGRWFLPGRDEANKKLFLPLGLYHSVGFGIRWFSPIGPLRFEWGIPLTRRAGDQAILFDFTIGNSF